MIDTLPARFGRPGRLARLAGATTLVASLALSACGPATAPAPAPDTLLTQHSSEAAAPLRAPRAAVVSATEIASRIGAQVLAEGGNAVDAAIATGFALAVTHPAAGNIGGGGFMVIRFPDGRTTTFNFREKAPLAAHPEMFVDPATGEYSPEMHHYSHLAVGVPGTVAGFALAHDRYGSSDWKRLVRPSVRLAADGFEVMEGLAESLAYSQAEMAEYPATLDAFYDDGEPYQVGELFRQPDLARTLERIMEQGRDGFYRGETARLLAAEMRRGGGMITEEDLARYEAQELEPVRGTYRGYDIIGMPPPSSGGIAVVEMLNILEGYELGELEHNSAEYLHLLAESMRRAFRDRARWVADMDFAEVPVERLTSKAYAAELRAGIDRARAGDSDPADVAQTTEGSSTTHYSVVDQNGMAVAVTYTLEHSYGSMITVPGAGFLLNNEMGDFNARPGLTTEQGLIGTHANLARPEQRMLSSMTPTIVAKDGRLVAVVGSPGGRTIINTVLQVILNVIDHDMGIQDAVNAKKLHHQWLPDRMVIEEGGATAAAVERLRAMGHEVLVRGRQGRANSIMIDPLTGDVLAAPDPRDPDAGAAGF